KNDISIYAIHTNLDNIAEGVNRMIAEKLNLKNCQVLQPKEGTLKKLVTFVPVKNAEEVRNALFRAGAGAIGNYDEVSFNVQGEGMFKANEGSKPFVGEIGQKHVEQETRIEVIFPSYLQNNIASSLKKHHPYEEVAYYITSLDNVLNSRGSGLVGELENEMSETELLDLLKKEFGLSVIKHTPLILQKVKKIALCGGSGFFLLPYAKSSGAQVYITADVKYHEFFDAEDTILLADIGHYESEQFTMNLLTEFLQQKFPNFAVQKTEMNTNPVNYY
ncbi:MAG: Nif3-like dinuclear metal center hexameric protein, partial [Ginsengibacter sp.]